MIYDEATLNFVIKQVEKIKDKLASESDELYLQFVQGGYMACNEILEMLENIKKIKAIN